MATVIIKDKNLKPENIKKGVTILKTTGTLDASGGGSISLQEKSVNSSTSDQVVTPGSGYDGLSKVNVAKYTLDAKTVDPSTSSQTVNSSADGLSSVTVNAVTSSIDSNISAGNIKKDVTILGVTGTLETGSTINNQDKSVNPSTNSQSVTYDSGYTGNIKDGVTILGVTGNYTGSGGGAQDIITIVEWNNLWGNGWEMAAYFTNDVSYGNGHDGHWAGWSPLEWKFNVYSATGSASYTVDGVTHLLSGNFSSFTISLTNETSSTCVQKAVTITNGVHTQELDLEFCLE